MRGGGRGKSATLPAWMTQQEKPNTVEVTKTAPDNGNNVESNNNGFNSVPVQQTNLTPHPQQAPSMPPMMNPNFYGQYAPPNMNMYRGAPPMPMPAHIVQWMTYKDPKGVDYYHNASTGVTTYDKPDELKTALEKSIPKCDWKEFTTPEGKKYWNNSITGVSVWDEPEEFKTFQTKMKELHPQVSKEVQSVTGVSNIIPKQSPVNIEQSTVTSAATTTAENGTGTATGTATTGNGNTVTPASDAISNIPSSIPPNNGYVPPNMIPGMIMPMNNMNTYPPPGVFRPPSHMHMMAPPAMYGGGNAVPPMMNPAMMNPMATAASTTTTASTETKISANETNNNNNNNTATAGTTPATKTISKPKSKSKSKPKPIVHAKKDIPVYKSAVEKRESFEALLNDKSVRPGQPWGEVYNLIKDDVRFVAVGKLGFKKQMYAEWSSRVKKERLQNERKLKMKLKSDFTAMLEESERITHKTVWREAELLLRSDERFIALENDNRTRMELFDEFVSDAVRLEKVNEKVKEEKTIASFELLLSETKSIDASTSWSDAKSVLRDELAYESLSRSVRERTFERYIAKLEQQNIEAFKSMLHERVDKGLISRGWGKWRDIEESLKCTLEYISLSEQRHASHRRIFEDVMGSYEKDIKSNAKIVSKVLNDTKLSGDFKITESSSYDDIVAALEVSLSKMKKLSNDSDNYSNLYSDFKDLQGQTSSFEECVKYILRKAVSAALEKKKKLEKYSERYRDLCDELFYRSHHLDYTWDDAKSKMREYDEYIDLDSDSLRKSIWTEHMKELRQYKQSKGKTDVDDDNRDVVVVKNDNDDTVKVSEDTNNGVVSTELNGDVDKMEADVSGGTKRKRIDDKKDREEGEMEEGEMTGFDSDDHRSNKKKSKKHHKKHHKKSSKSSRHRSRS